MIAVYFAIRSLLSRRILAEKCGHMTRQMGKVGLDREFEYLVLNLNEHGNTDFCLSCLQKMSTRCAICGRPVLVGDQVTPVHSNMIHDLPYADLTKEKGEVVMCFRMGCHDVPANLGVWMPDENGRGRVGCMHN